MKKIYLSLLFLLGSFSFSNERYVNKCNVLSKSYDYNKMIRKSLESGKTFKFYIGRSLLDLDYLYKIFILEDEETYILVDYEKI